MWTKHWGQVKTSTSEANARRLADADGVCARPRTPVSLDSAACWFL